jgi:hypothetical protein
MTQFTVTATDKKISICIGELEVVHASKTDTGSIGISCIESIMAPHALHLGPAELTALAEWLLERAREREPKPQFDHPCRETCSGWKQGYERGLLARAKERG